MIETRYYIECIEVTGARARMAGPFLTLGAGEEALPWTMRADPTACPAPYLSRADTRPRERLWRVHEWCGRDAPPGSWLGVPDHSREPRDIF
jgi:hypothetical protein